LIVHIYADGGVKVIENGGRRGPRRGDRSRTTPREMIGFG